MYKTAQPLLYIVYRIENRKEMIRKSGKLINSQHCSWGDVRWQTVPEAVPACRLYLVFISLVMWLVSCVT